MTEELTIGILRRDDDPHIDETIKSIESLPVDILVISQQVFEHPAARVVIKPWGDDFSRARNDLHRLSKGKWVFHLDSDETLDPTSISILMDEVNKEPAVVKVSVLSSGSRVMLPRLVPTRAKWKRPSHEIPIFNGPIRVEQRVLIRHTDLTEEESASRAMYNVSLLENEFERTKDPDLLFLCAIDYTFLNPDRCRYFANRFLHEFGSGPSEKMKMQCLLMEYTLAFIDGMSKKDIPGAIRRVRKLIAKRMDLSELWCLLGDLYLMLNSPTQAREIYENALVIGEGHDFMVEDRMWIDMDKYGDYPRARIQQCDKMIHSGIRGRTG